MSAKADIVVGRHGTSATGTVGNETFTIVDEFGKHKIKKGKIASIRFAVPEQQVQDDMQLLVGDLLVGEIIDEKIFLHVEVTDEDLTFRKDQVLAIVFGR